MWAVRGDELLIADTFYLGPRPRNDDGRLRDVFANTSLNDFWVQFPGNAGVRWRAGDGHDFGWQFSASSLDRLEPPEWDGGNGTLTARGNPAALADFNSPAGAFAVAANLLPLGTNDWVAIGFTSSGVLSNNFQRFAEVWLRFWGSGEFEVRTRGTNGQARKGRVTKIGFTPAKLAFDPASGQVSGFVNETRFEEFVAEGVGTIAYVGLEARTADPTFFAHANYFRVTRLNELSAEPRLEIEHSGVGRHALKLSWPANANSFVLEQESTVNRFGPWKSLWSTNIVGNQITVTNSPTNELGIFRLREL